MSQSKYRSSSQKTSINEKLSPLATILVIVLIIFAISGALIASEEAPAVSAALWFLTALVTLASAMVFIVQVSFSDRELHVRSGLLRVPFMKVDLSKVESVTCEDFSATSWGGWGLRFKPGGRALVLRGKRAVVIREYDGRRTVLAILNADRVVASMKNLVSRDSRQSSHM